MNKPVINIADVELKPRPSGFAPTGGSPERYESRMGAIGNMLDSRRLGYNITAVPPGKRAFPPHNHQINEEMFFVLEGTGEVRIGETVYPIRPGDIVACLAGGKEMAHVVTNTGNTELKYLAISTRISPETCEYPETGKYTVFSEKPVAPGTKPDNPGDAGREGADVNFWEGE
ncbi:MAG: cupin domain-containing protein [Gammaproteobacteria bacterium]|nr:cupin domain-containing protein [Gammaproteobacteria bacterium]